MTLYFDKDKNIIATKTEENLIPETLRKEDLGKNLMNLESTATPLDHSKRLASYIHSLLVWCKGKERTKVNYHKP